VLWIQIRSDQILLTESGSGKKSFRIRAAPDSKLICEFEVKLLGKTGKFEYFSTKNAHFKNINSFLSKKYSLKSLSVSHHNNLTTLARQEYKGKIYVKHIRKNLIYIGSETGSGSEKQKLRIHNAALKCWPG
jgi:hypothetical protein